MERRVYTEDEHEVDFKYVLSPSRLFWEWPIYFGQ
jgi:hypothetical protein